MALSAKQQAKAEKAARAREKKERKALEAAMKQSAIKVDEARALIADPTATANAVAAVAGKNLPDFHKALATLTEAVELHAENSDALQLLGDCHREQRHYDDALSKYTDCITLAPANWRALEGRAFCFEQKKDWDQALTDWDAAAEVRPDADYPVCMRAAARLHKRSSGLRLRRAEFELVELDLKAALRLNPHNHQAHCTLAACYEAHGMFNLAVEHYTKALQVHTAYDHALYRRGQCAIAAVEARQDADGEAARLAAEMVLNARREGLALPKGHEPTIQEQLAAEEEAAKRSASERELLVQAIDDFTVLIVVAAEKERKNEELPMLLHRATAWMLLQNVPEDPAGGGGAADLVMARSMSMANFGKSGAAPAPLDEAAKDLDFVAANVSKADPTEHVGGALVATLQDVLRIKNAELNALKAAKARRKADREQRPLESAAMSTLATA